MTAERPRVVIVGGGFGGLAAARGLARAPVDVTLLDRTNHHLFQPLLYQVATAGLSPAEIACPIRRILRRQRNARVLLGEAGAIDSASRRVRLADGEIAYDYLIVAAGATPLLLRARRVGGPRAGAQDARGRARDPPAGARSPSRRRSAKRTPRRGAARSRSWSSGAGRPVSRWRGPSPRSPGTPSPGTSAASTRGPRASSSSRWARASCRRYPEELSEKAKRQLEALGVQVWTGAAVTGVDASGVEVGADRIATRTVVWAVGVLASPLARSLGAPLDRAGRVRVLSDLTVPGKPTVFVIGDLASLEQDGRPVPGVAPAAIQMGAHAARNVLRALRGEPSCRSATGTRARSPRSAGGAGSRCSGGCASPAPWPGSPGWACTSSS